ncbi:class I SAM-dependent methyltransferase [Haliangium ochraceum]|uniref:Methyltransferase type 11 n=1 Tax=Haliangium ochraceum (strain DSM 14365 / JCM 11303 / SMP-2) TaxID=502025 RepID=D0LRK1_HALO1|nr:class I SAM-dependent methyltransferase [Haliangium ochraceum]ACY17229.1 Methyltransferase type 11 [Haliangium ochraceum DSM 14365]
MKTDTAHRHWEERWQSEDGRADWSVPEPWVTACARQQRERGARTALDLGSGAGRHALLLAELGFETSALDAAAAGIESLRREAASRGLQIAATAGDMCALPYADQAFDYVLSFNVIYHGDKAVVSRAITEIARVLRPGGVFQGTMLSLRNHNVGEGEEISPGTWVRTDGQGDEDKAHPHFYCSAHELCEMFSGFEPLSLEDVEQGAGSWHWQLIAERR